MTRLHHGQLSSDRLWLWATWTTMLYSPATWLLVWDMLVLHFAYIYIYIYIYYKCEDLRICWRLLACHGNVCKLVCNESKQGFNGLTHFFLHYLMMPMEYFLLNFKLYHLNIIHIYIYYHYKFCFDSTIL